MAPFNDATSKFHVPNSAPVPDLAKFKNEIAKGSYGTVKNPGVRKKNVPKKLKEQMVENTGEGKLAPVSSVPTAPSVTLDLSAIWEKWQKFREAKKNNPSFSDEEISSALNKSAMGRIKEDAPVLSQMDIPTKAASGLLSEDEKVRLTGLLGGEKQFNDYVKKKKYVQEILNRDAYWADDKVLESFASNVTLWVATHRNVETALSKAFSPLSDNAKLYWEALDETKEGSRILESQREKSKAEIGAGIVGSFYGYGGVTKASKWLLKYAPQSVEILATKSPHLWDATVGNVIQNGIEAGVRKSTSQDYSFEDFVLWLGLNAVWEWAAKWIGMAFDKTVEGGVKASDLKRMDEAVAIVRRRNPSATPQELREALWATKLSNGKTVDDLFFDFQTKKMAGVPTFTSVSVKDLGRTKAFAGGGYADEVGEYLLNNGKVASYGAKSRVSSILSHLDESSAPEPKTVEEAVANAWEDASDKFRSAFLSKLKSYESPELDDKAVTKAAKEAAMETGYDYKSLPKVTNKERNIISIVEKGSGDVESLRRDAEQFVNFLSKDEGRSITKRLESAEPIDSLYKDVKKFVEDRGIKLDESIDYSKPEAKAILIDSVNEADNRSFYRAKPSYVKEVNKRVESLRKAMALEKGKVTAFKELESGRKEFSSMANAYASESHLPQKEISALRNRFGVKASQAKSLEDVGSATAEFASAIDAKETKYLTRNIGKELALLTKNSTDEESAYLAGLVKDTFESFDETGDINSLRSLSTQIEAMRKDGISFIKEYDASVARKADMAARIVRHELAVNGVEKFGLKKALKKGADDTSESFVKDVTSGMDMPYRVFEESLPPIRQADGSYRQNPLNKLIYSDVYDAKSRGDARIASFNKSVPIDELSVQEAYEARVAFYALQKEGHDIVTRAENFLIDKSGNLAINPKKGVRRWTREDVKRIVEKAMANPKIKNVVDKVLSHTDSLGDELQQIAAREGKPFRKGSNYTPFQYIDATGREPTDVFANVKTDAITKGMDEGFLQSRTSRPARYSLDFDLVSMVTRIAQEINYVELRWPMVVAERAIKAATDDYNVIDKGLANYSKRWMEDVARNGYYKSSAQWFDKAANVLTRIAAARAMGASPKSAAIQLTSLLEMEGQRPGWFSKSVTDMFGTTNGETNYQIARKYSGALASRSATDTPEVALESKLKGMVASGVEKFERFIYYVMRRSDGMTATSAWFQNYRHFMETYGGLKRWAPLDWNNVNLMAVSYADREMESLMGSVRAGSTPLSYRNPMVRASMFLGRSTLNRYQNFLYQLGRADKAAAEKATTVIGYALSSASAATLGILNAYMLYRIGAKDPKWAEAGAMRELDEILKDKSFAKWIGDLQNLLVLSTIQNSVGFNEMYDWWRKAASYAMEQSGAESPRLKSVLDVSSFWRNVSYFQSVEDIGKSLATALWAVPKSWEQVDSEKVASAALQLLPTYLSTKIGKSIDAGIKAEEKGLTKSDYVESKAIDASSQVDKSYLKEKKSEFEASTISSFDFGSRSEWNISERKQELWKQIKSSNALLKAYGLGEVGEDGKVKWAAGKGSKDVSRIIDSIYKKRWESKVSSWEQETYLPESIRKYSTITVMSPKAFVELELDGKSRKEVADILNAMRKNPKSGITKSDTDAVWKEYLNKQKFGNE